MGLKSLEQFGIVELAVWDQTYISRVGKRIAEQVTGEVVAVSKNRANRVFMGRTVIGVKRTAGV